MRAAPRTVRVDASDAARVAHILEDNAEDEAAARAARAARLDAALALVAKRLGPDDTARTKRYWTRATSRRARACCWRGTTQALRPGRRPARRRGAVRADDPFETDAVAADVVVAVSCADAADLPPPPLVEVTRPPPSARDDDCVQWCAPSEPRLRIRAGVGQCAATASRFAALLRVN